MTDYEFYQLTKSRLEKMADLQDIPLSELQKYYSNTDQYCQFYNDASLSEISKIFAQMTFHMQNATMISNIVKFDKNYEFLKKITFNFVPDDFINHYSGANRVDALVNDLRFNSNTQEGLVWNSSKSISKDAIAKRFANSLFECAEYLKNFKTKASVLNDLKSNANINNVDDLLAYFNSKIKTGFSVALTCDFLKEFDTCFEFLPKPDIHIKDVIITLKNKNENYYNSPKKELELIKEVQTITENINTELRTKGENEITVYQLDRMIWLVCTDNFFIHGNNVSSKKKYIDQIKASRP